MIAAEENGFWLGKRDSICRKVALRHGVTSPVRTTLSRVLLESNHRRGTETATSQEPAHYLNGEPAMARPTSKVYRPQEYVRRHPIALAAIFGLGSNPTCFSGEGS